MEQSHFRTVLSMVRKLYGNTLAVEFGPMSLKTVREQMVAKGWSRLYLNQQTMRVKRIFRWAVENELLPGGIYHALQAVPGLKRGRSRAKESTPVRPVPQELIDAVKPFVSRQVWAMIQLQLLTGARSGEMPWLHRSQAGR